MREFELLWSNEWADAKVALDEYADWKVKDKDKYEILTSALMVRIWFHFRNSLVDAW